MRYISNRVLNLNEYFSEIKSILFHNALLNSSNTIHSKIFLDTNILLFQYRLNKKSRDEFSNFLNEIIDQNRLCIPNWVIYEFNRHLEHNNNLVFHPYLETINKINSLMNEIERNAKYLVESEVLSGTQYRTKKRYFSDFEKTKKQLSQLLVVLKKYDTNKEKDAITKNIKKIISSSFSKINIFKLLPKLETEAKLRFSEKIPPGFQDGKKESNSLGDLIIWKEILEITKKGNLNSILISNDEKSDWMYSPETLIYNGEKFPNNGTKFPVKILIPKSSLINEYLSLQPEGKLFIISWNLLCFLLSDDTINIQNYKKFKNLKEANNIYYIREKDQTIEVIRWFLSNPEILNEAIYTVAKWHLSPNEIIVEDLIEWIALKNNSIKVEKVDIEKLIVELFI